MVVGTDIGFFEYHNDITNLDEEKIPHFSGCVSFTTKYKVDGEMKKILEDKDHIPKNLKHLFFNSKRLRIVKDKDKNIMREEAREYDLPCIFDIREHQKEIEFMFKHMVRNVPRSSI